MKRRRLLAVSHDFSLTGAPIALFNLIEGLKSDFDLLVAAPNDGPLRQIFLAAGVRAIVEPNLLSDVSVCGALLASSDGLLANTLLSCVPIHAASQCGKPSVWYLHEGHIGAALMQRFPEISSALPLATCVVYPAQFTQALYAGLRGTHRVEVIPYGVPNQKESPPSGGSGPINVLQLGSVEVRKGQDIALAAFRQLGADRFRLSLVGSVQDGNYKQQLTACIADLPNVRFLDGIPKNEVPELLRSCDILIVPSRDEVTPMVILEAMALGKPVVAARITGIPEMIVHGETGMLFEKENPAQLAALLVQLESDLDLRQRLGRNGRRFQREQRTLEQCQKRFSELLFSLMKIEPGVSTDLVGELPPPADYIRKRTSLPVGDYVSPNLAVVRLDDAFPNMIVGDTSRNPWPYLRRGIPHNWYVDRRDPGCGFLSRDEAHIVYHTARQFAGKRALEIGCWFGWSAAHMAKAGVLLDVIDPLLSNAVVLGSVTESLKAAGVLNSVNLHAGSSPQKVLELVDQAQRKWSLLFIDGDHEGAAPLKDTMACAPHAEADAIVLFHDLASPHVADGLHYLRAQGWHTMVYETMQIMGVAWRGNVTPVEHCPDPDIREALPDHLCGYPVSGRKSVQSANGVPTAKRVEIAPEELVGFVESCPPHAETACTGDRTQFLRLLREGRQAAINGDAPLALRSLNEALGHATNSYAVHDLLADVYDTVGAWRESLRHRIYAYGSHNHITAIDQAEFSSILETVRPFSMLSDARLLSLYVLARQVCLDDLPGNFVECGTCKGGSAALLAAVIQRYSMRPRKVYAFDTYEGMPDPTDVDRHDGVPANATGFGSGQLKASIEENLAVICDRLKVQDIVVPAKGLFQDTLPWMRDQIGEIAFLHADADWYESTLDILQILFDRVAVHGIIQIDDYGFWEGCRKAVHDFEAARSTWFPLSRIDETGVWFRKVEDTGVSDMLLARLRETAQGARAKGDHHLAVRSEAALLRVLPALIQTDKSRTVIRTPVPAAPADVISGPPGMPMPIPKAQANPFGTLVLSEAQRRAFFHDLIVQTRNFSHITWLGYPIWQNVLDLWTLQETISQIKPALLIETGTNRGGSALFFAHLFDLLGQGRVVTLDLMKMHEISHPRIRFLIGSSVATDVFKQVQAEVAAVNGPVMVILDSDHAAQHVFNEMELYGPLVTPGSYMLVQDGAIDEMDAFRGGRPGPLVAIEEFLKRHAEFELDSIRCERFLITHHPKGWLRRKGN